MGTIPDWTPVEYTPEDVEVPPYLPDMLITRSELTGINRAANRMDQGVEKSLQDFGFENNTLVTFMHSSQWNPLSQCKDESS